MKKHAVDIKHLRNRLNASSVRRRKHIRYLFDQALYTEKLIKSKPLAVMFTPGLENSGYAWEILRQFNRQLVRADGRSWGFTNSLARYPADKVTVIVLSNIETAGANKIADKLSAIVFGEKYENP